MIVSHEDLSKINDAQFEKLIKTLLLSIIGNGVTPFSQGKDGAREAIYKGKANYPSNTDNWEGNWIFQVKYSNIAFGLDKARNQIKYSIDNELKKLEEYGYFESNKCDNYIYITNVPFSGQAEKGLHDYVDKKNSNYKVKNFHYWDGEKVLGFLNSYPVVRETFFPSPGIEFLDDKFLSEVNNIFVKPNLYDKFKEELLINKILNIVGQPHVGKTFFSLFLANDVFKSEQLDSIVIIPIIDNLQSIPKLNNCVIIFDDLYGDLNFDSIGKKSKTLSSLLNRNYIIVTSRDYIFQEAITSRELLIEKKYTIDQEGAYSDLQLERILLNHVNVNFPKSIENDKAYDYILRNKSLVVQELRFPHNLQLFTTTLDKTVTNKKILVEKILKAKLIDNLIVTWISQQSSINRNILLALAIGRIQGIDVLENICESQWNYNESTITNCVVENHRLLQYDQSTVRYKHPSFKTAIVNYFLLNYYDVLADLVLYLTFTSSVDNSKIINRSLAYQIIEKLEISQLIKFLQMDNVGSNFLEVLWLNIIRKDPGESIHLLIRIMNEMKRGNKYFKSFVASKAFMKDKEIISLINFFLTQRHLNGLVEKLIEHFAYRVRLNVRPIANSLSYKVPKDFSLKIKLLGCIGTKYPDLVIHELISYTFERSASARRQVYSALNMLDRSVKELVETTYLEILPRETNGNNIRKIRNSLSKIRK